MKRTIATFIAALAIPILSPSAAGATTATAGQLSGYISGAGTWGPGGLYALPEPTVTRWSGSMQGTFTVGAREAVGAITCSVEQSGVDSLAGGSGSAWMSCSGMTLLGSYVVLSSSDLAYVRDGVHLTLAGSALLAIGYDQAAVELSLTLMTQPAGVDVNPVALSHFTVTGTAAAGGGSVAL